MNSNTYYSYPYIKDGKLKSDFVESKQEAHQKFLEAIYYVGELLRENLETRETIKTLLDQLEKFEIQKVLPEIVMDLRKEEDNVK
jgi:hypothetical protein